jgi:hypothetical protein
VVKCNPHIIDLCNAVLLEDIEQGEKGLFFACLEGSGEKGKAVLGGNIFDRRRIGAFERGSNFWLFLD